MNAAGGASPRQEGQSHGPTARAGSDDQSGSHQASSERGEAVQCRPMPRPGPARQADWALVAGRADGAFQRARSADERDRAGQARWAARANGSNTPTSVNGWPTCARPPTSTIESCWLISATTTQIAGIESPTNATTQPASATARSTTTSDSAEICIGPPRLTPSTARPPPAGLQHQSRNRRGLATGRGPTPISRGPGNLLW